MQVIDKRPQWIERTTDAMPPIKLGQTVERRYRDGEEQSFVVNIDQIKPSVWRNGKNDPQNDITHCRIVCDEQGRTI